MRHGVMWATMLAMAAWAGPAAAASYMFSYGAGGSTIASGVIKTDSTMVQPGALNVVDITGSRLSVAITGYDYYAEFGDQLIFPASADARVDGAGITYQIGDYSYNLYSTGSGFYTEFRYLTADSSIPGEGTFVDSFILTPVAATGAVPEPASWVTMIAGLAIAGAALRRRGRAEAPTQRAGAR